MAGRDTDMTDSSPGSRETTPIPGGSFSEGPQRHHPAGQPQTIEFPNYQPGTLNLGPPPPIRSPTSLNPGFPTPSTPYQPPVTTPTLSQFALQQQSAQLQQAWAQLQQQQQLYNSLAAPPAQPYPFQPLQHLPPLSLQQYPAPLVGLAHQQYSAQYAPRSNTQPGGVHTSQFNPAGSFSLPGPSALPPGPSSRKSSTSTVSDAGSTRNAVTASSSSKGRKRRRDNDQGANPNLAAADAHSDPRLQHGIPDHAKIEHLQQQNDTIMKRLEQLAQMAQQTTKPEPAEQSLAGDNEITRQLLESLNEQTKLLRDLAERDRTRTKRRERERGSGAKQGAEDGHDADNEDDGMDGDDDMEEVEEEGDVVDDPLDLGMPSKTSPDRRPDRDVKMAREIRKIFNNVYKGCVVNPGQAPADGSDPPRPTMDNLVLDPTARPLSTWNRGARDSFVVAVFAEQSPKLMKLRPEREDVERLFVSNFRRVRAQYEWAKLTPAQKFIRKQKHRRRERRRSLYWRRLGAALRYPETKRHVPMIRAYGVDGMSSDESDHNNNTGHPLYMIRNKIWRNPYATSCLRTVDALHRDNRFLPVPVRSMTSGANPRDRITGEKNSTSRPVKRLPRALYNPEWLANQPPVVKQSLQVSDSPDYNWAHDPTIEDLAKVNNGKLDSIFGFA